jgi:hypothetical protein
LCCVFNKVAADLFFFFLRRLFVLSNQFLERRLFRAKIVDDGWYVGWWVILLIGWKGDMTWHDMDLKKVF